MSTVAVGVLGSKGAGTRNQEATIYIGNLDEKITEDLLQELFIQVGPVTHVHIPRDRLSQSHQGYGFVEFQTEEDADYAIRIMNGVKMFGKPLKINKSSQDRKNLDVGANIFIGNLAPEIDEKALHDTFILFGTLIATPKVARDEATGVSKGYGFLSYDSFEVSDAAIEGMNGQYLGNRPVTVNYAYKKDGKGERHGTAAERLLAANAKKQANAPSAIVTPNPPASAPMQPGVAGMSSMPTGMPVGYPPNAIPPQGYPQVPMLSQGYPQSSIPPQGYYPHMSHMMYPPYGINYGQYPQMMPGQASPMGYSGYPPQGQIPNASLYPPMPPAYPTPPQGSSSYPFTNSQYPPQSSNK